MFWCRWSLTSARVTVFVLMAPFFYSSFYIFIYINKINSDVCFFRIVLHRILWDHTYFFSFLPPELLFFSISQWYIFCHIYRLHLFFCLSQRSLWDTFSFFFIHPKLHSHKKWQGVLRQKIIVSRTYQSVMGKSPGPFATKGEFVASWNTATAFSAPWCLLKGPRKMSSYQ